MIYLAFFALLFILAARSRMAYVLRVKDGDTIEALWRGKKVSMRLAGIDAPESRQKGGKDATEALKRLCLHQWVQIKVIREKDKHGRPLVEIDDINRKLVQTGHAFAYLSKKYAADEAKAKKRRVGVHRLAMMKPWEWRKRKV